MLKILRVLTFLLIPFCAWGQINNPSTSSGPGGTTGQIQYNAGNTTFGGFTMSGDCTLVYSTGAITCTDSNGTPFGTAAFDNTGISGATIPLLNAANTWSATQNIITAGSGQLYVASTGTNIPAITLDDQAGSQTSVIQFNDAGNVKWQLSKDTSNLFHIYDGVGGKYFLSATTGSNLILGDQQNFYIAHSTGYTYMAAPSGSLASFYACYDPSSSPVGEISYQATNCTTSLRSTKHSIKPYVSGLKDALALRPSTFVMNRGTAGHEEIGLIAEDTEAVNSDLAGYQDGKLRTVQYDRTGVVAIAAIQDQQKEIEDLKVQILKLRRAYRHHASRVANKRRFCHKAK